MQIAGVHWAPAIRNVSGGFPFRAESGKATFGNVNSKADIAEDFVPVRVDFAQEDNGVKMIVSGPRNAKARHDGVLNSVLFDLFMDAGERRGNIYGVPCRISGLGAAG